MSTNTPVVAEVQTPKIEAKAPGLKASSAAFKFSGAWDSISKRARLFFGKWTGSERRTRALLTPKSIAIKRQQQELTSHAKAIEHQFLAAGSALEQLSNLSDELVRQGEQLLEIATGKTDAKQILSETIRLMEDPLSFIDSTNQTFTAWLARLEAFDHKIEALLRTHELIERTLAPLQMIRTLFRVETATLPPDVQRMFLALIEDIERLHVQVRENFGVRFKPLQQTRETLAGVTRRLRQNIAKYGSFAAEKRTSIHRTLGVLETDLEASSKLDIRLGQTTQRISSEVNQVVMGMQYQDITNQRIQHVQASLSEIAEHISKLDSLVDPTARRRSLAFIHQASQVQIAQLAGVRDDLTKAEHQISTGIGRILDIMKDMDAECLDLREFEQHTTSSDGMVQILLNIIHETRDLFDVTTRHIEEAHSAIAPLGGLTSDLTEIVRRLSFEIQLIGLNSQIQAAAIGEGTGLEVLSAHISEISHETSRISSLAARELDEVAITLKQGVDEFGLLGQTARAEQAKLNETGGAQENQLHAFRDRAFQALKAVADLIHQVKEKAQDTLSTIRFSHQDLEALDHLDKTLSEIRTVLAENVEDSLLNHSQNEISSELRKNYTMASEHIAFNQSAAVTAPNAPTPTGSAQPAVGEIVLFDDFAPSSVAQKSVLSEHSNTAEAAALSAPATKPIVVDPSPAAPSQSVAPAAAKKEDLGDNIELF